MSQIWQEALEQLRERLGQQNFETWIKPIQVRETTETEIFLEVPNKFFRDWLNEHFLRPIHETVSVAAQRDVKVSLAVNQKLQALAPALERRVEREAPKPQPQPRLNNLIPKYTFENFVVGASNQ